MGQSSSRPRTPAPTSSSSLSGNTSLHEGGSSSNSGHIDSPNQDAPLRAKRSRRSSFRRSILGLIPSSSSSSSSSRSTRDNESPNVEDQPTVRKRWRSSRRWSKTPAQLADMRGPVTSDSAAARDVQGAGAENSPLGVAEVIPIGAQSRPSRPSTPLPTSGPSSSDAETPAGDSTSHRDHQASDNIGWLGGTPPSSSAQNPPIETLGARSIRPNTHDIEREVTEFLHGRSNDTEHDNLPAVEYDSETQPQPEFPSSPVETPQQPPSQRQFPPPGTLVVVQGVVNTTDTPHTTSPQASSSVLQHTPSSIPRPTPSSSSSALPTNHRRTLSTSHITSRNADERRNSRNRLSSFIRPSGMLGRVAADNELESDLTSNSQSAPDTSTQENTQTSASSASYPVDTSQASRSPDAAAGQRGLSPGSIDVLGTLLSVAASATAASLFSPGLHLNNPSGIAPLNSPMSTTNPLSSVPPAGLGALGGLGGLAGLGLNPGVPSTAPGIGQDNRMRNMWENIRERMGLIPRTPGLPDAINPGERILDDVATQERTPRMRPGELMLAEMARALNAGLGLANSTERRAGDRTAEVPSGPGHVLFASTADPSQPLPPEGSFERFLVNLQTDLRAILTEDGSSTQPESTPLAQPDANTPPVQDLDATSSAPHVDSSVQDAVEPSALDVEDEGQPLSPPASSNTDSDSDGEYEEAEDEDEDSQDVSAGHLSLPPAPRTPTPIPPTGGIPYNLEESFITDNEASQDTGAHRPAINLWRLYRFEAVPANQTQDHASRTSSPPTTGPNITSTTPPSSPPSPLAARPSQGRPGEPDPRANVVVPVIVVGLQSVDVAGQDEAEDEAMMPLYQYESGSSGPTDDPSNGGTLQDGPAGRSGTARGRTWQSRAANAFRTLRPGRRGGSRSRRTAEGAGSRTFLIYVIGGYYPPNHHMVTGSDRLDSYEALWELAELLGQVKPPTATRQDIDNSGLQIIKASELGMYEQQGRIASNCVDRCLVCLDDYETEDELRLMTCRHAFHKGCVDKWLQIGRNNCPACRTKGVSVFGESSPEPTETATESQS